jgi:hypothetical protein
VVFETEVDKTAFCEVGRASEGRSDPDSSLRAQPFVLYSLYPNADPALQGNPTGAALRILRPCGLEIFAFSERFHWSPNKHHSEFP